VSPRAALGRLWADRRGTVAALAAFAVLLTGATSMFAADLGRIQLARSRLQASADAAMLAAARDLGKSEAELTAVAEAVFDVNMAMAAADLAVTRFDLSFPGAARPEIADTVRLEVDAALPLLSVRAAAALRWIGFDRTRVDLAVVAAAHKRVMGAEIVMVLDNTGSMNGQPIADLRTAARTLTEAVFGGAETIPNVYMGIVNYAATVNIGRQHEDWLTPASRATLAADFAPTRWKGCVLVRAKPGDPLTQRLPESDDPPTVARFEPQIWPSSRLSWSPLAWDAYYLMTGASRSVNVWPPGDPKDPTKPDPKKPAVNETQSAGNNGYGPNLGCPAPITPLVSSRTAILNAIDGRDGVPGIEAWHRGGTFGNVGLAWGWRALSPRWRGLWRDRTLAANPALPVAYDTPYHRKIIVLMTDGANNHFQSDMTAYGRPNEILPKNDIDASMSRLCENIKAAGIIIFTVTFTAPDNPVTKIYKGCASPETHPMMPGQKYFNAPSGAELISVFGRIGGQISELRLVN
jgi:hypothetical protein